MYKSLNEYNVEAKLTDKFKQNFTLQFEEKMKNFFENEYKYCG